MPTIEQMYIPLNNRKLAGLLQLSIGFILSGLFLASSIRINHSLFVIIISCLGIACLIFFAPLTFSLFKKTTDCKAGITIDRTGITDNTILFSVGHIPWSDIQEIKRNDVLYGKLLIIIVNNPTEYISRQSNFGKIKMMKMLFKKYGSPIIITSNELKGDFDNLQDILQTKLNEHKS